MGVSLASSQQGNEDDRNDQRARAAVHGPVPPDGLSQLGLLGNVLNGGRELVEGRRDVLDRLKDVFVDARPGLVHGSPPRRRDLSGWCRPAGEAFEEGSPVLVRSTVP